MSRLFISHSSRDNAYALAFQNWLSANGWDRDDVFIDLHNIGAGQRWRDTLRKANAACEAVVLLASPDALDSIECQKELDLAEALGKEVIVAVLRDLAKDDSRLARYSDRQFIDLSAFPQDHVEALTWEGREHRIAFNPEALFKIKARLDELGIAPGSFAWPPKGATAPEPYPGLAAFGEDDAGIFFGRDADVMAALTEIRLVRRRRSPRLLVIDAASGAGKSSFLRAGLWPRLKRDPEFAPLALLRPAQGIISGPDGLGRRLAPWFERFGQPRPPGLIHAPLLNADDAAAARTLATLVGEAVDLATAARRATVADAKAPAPIIAIDQGEELFAAEDDGESRRFLAMLAELLNAPPPGLDPYVLITIRADSVQTLLTRAAELHLETPKAIYLPPLSPAAYREVILKPAEIYSARVRRLTVDPALANALVAEATGADALPLLAFTLSRMFGDYHADGQLTLERYREMGGIGGSIGRALKQAQAKAGNVGSDAHLRRLLLPRLATWDPEADGSKGAAKRLVALRDEVIGGARADLAPLCDALVDARLLTRSRDTLEVAHEALLRRPPISHWLEEDREFLIWRDRLGKARAAYEANTRGLLVGRELQIARDWLAQRVDPEDIAGLDRSFITASSVEAERRRTEDEEKERKRAAAELELARIRETEARIREEAARERELKAAVERQAAEERAQAAQAMAAASRRAARRIMFGAVAALTLAVVASALGFYALSLAETAKKAEARADATRDEALLAQSKALTYYALEQTEKENNPTLGVLLALEALPDTSSKDEVARDRKLWPAAEIALAKAKRTSREIRVKPHPSGVRSFRTAPSGSRAITGLDNGTAVVWDTETGADVFSLECYNRLPVTFVAYSRDGSRVVTATGRVFQLWNADTGQHLYTFKGHTDTVNTVAFSPDGSLIASASRDTTIRIWSVASGSEVHAFRDHTADASAVWLPDGARLIATAKNSARIIDAKSGAELHKLAEDETKEVFISHDGARVVTKVGTSGKIWDISGAEPRLVRTIELRANKNSELFGQEPVKIAIGLDGNHIAATEADAKTQNNSIRVLDLDRNDETQIVTVAVPGFIALSRTGHRAFAVFNDQAVRVWSVVPQSQRVRIPIPRPDQGADKSGYLANIAVAGNAQTIVASVDHQVLVWNGKSTSLLEGDGKPIGPLAVDDTGARVVAALQDGAVVVWDTSTGGKLRTFPAQNTEVLDLGISGNGFRAVTGSKDAGVRVWDTSTGELLRVIKEHTGPVSRVAVSANGTRALTASADGTARLWDTSTGAMIRIWQDNDKLVEGVWLSSDGTRAHISSQRETAIWDVSNGEKLRTLDLDKNFTFSRDGMAAAHIRFADDLTNVLEIWDLTRGTKVDEHNLGESMSLLFGKPGLSFSPERDKVVYVDDSGLFRSFPVLPFGQALVADAKANLSRCLTTGERKKYSLPVAPPKWCIETARWPYDELGSYRLARNLIAAQDGEEAEIYLDVLSSRSRSKADSVRAESYLDLGKRTMSNAKAAEQARRWLEKAAELGNSAAMVELGAIYANGTFVDKDYDKALSWYSRAASFGDTVAMENVGLIYNNDLTGQKDYAKAREWFEKAVSSGATVVARQVGLMYLNGWGVEKDSLKAIEWYEKAAAVDDGLSMTIIGEIYLWGQGVPQDIGAARAWFAKGIVAGGSNGEELMMVADVVEAVSKENYDEALRLQERVVELTRKADAADYKGAEKTAPQRLGQASWYALLAGKPDRALAAADEALSVQPNLLWVETNRAHALMYLGQSNEALAVYRAHIGKAIWENNNKLWQEVIREDFAVLRKAGRDHKMMEEIEAELNGHSQ